MVYRLLLQRGNDLNGVFVCNSHFLQKRKDTIIVEVRITWEFECLTRAQIYNTIGSLQKYFFFKHLIANTVSVPIQMSG